MEVGQNTLSVQPCSSNAERCKKWRKSQGKDFKLQEAERKKQSRKNRTPAQIERDRSTAKDRMRRMREKRKADDQNTSHTNKENHVILTRHQTEKQRKNWREAKQRYRAKIGSQKKRRIKEKDKVYRQDHRQKTVKNVKSKYCPNDEDDCSESPTFTPEAKRKAVFRIRQRMPTDAKKYAVVLTGLMKTTPRKRKAISKTVSLTPSKKQRLDFLEESMQNIRKKVEESKKTNKEADVKKRKLIAKTAMSALRKYRKLKKSSCELGIRYNTMLKWSTQENGDRKKRSDALTSNTIQEINDFFIKPEISVNNPDKKIINKDLKPKHFLNLTKKEAYKTFKNEKNVEISESKFWKLKPKNVVPLKRGKMRQCLCEKCINVEMKLKVLNKHNSTEKKTPSINKYDVNKLTLCEGHQKMKCIERNCSDCGSNKLEGHFSSIAKSSETVNWYQWESKKIKEPRPSTKKILALKSTSLKTLLKELIKDVNDLSSHLFFANWQYKQFSSLKERMPNNTLLCVMDYAENYSTRYQDECQSAHWCYEQITIHPIVCYFKGSSGKTVTEEVVYLSDDLNHDANFVDFCFRNCVQLLKRSCGFSPSKIVNFTDGCSSQYKSKIPFMDISCYKDDLDIEVERHFFGSGHGKGPADGCSGVVKAALTRAVIAGNVLSTAGDIFSFVTKNLTKDDEFFKRTFVFVDKTDVPRQRPLRKDALTIPGTRLLHCVKSVAQGKILTRKVSCTCRVCLDPHGENGAYCQNADLVDSWTEKTLLKSLRKTEKKQQKTKSDGKKKGKKSNLPLIENGNVKQHGEVQTEVNLANSSNEENSQNTLVPFEDVDVRKTVFQYIFDDLQTASNYDELQAKCLHHADVINQFPIIGSSSHSVVSTKKAVDKDALDLWPEEEPYKETVKYPVCVQGDGNCLPRAGSVLAFGDEEDHLEIRTRMVVEMVLNENVYLDEEYLTKGTNQKTAVNNFVMYSDSYTVGDHITPNIARDILRQDTIKFSKIGAYGNGWQLFALASVLQCKIFAIYPERGNPIVRKHLNREMYPRIRRSSDIVFLMWTSNRTKQMREIHWVPNHFVPVLPLHTQITCSNEDSEDHSFVQDSHQSSLDGIDFDINEISLEMLNPTVFDLERNHVMEVQPLERGDYGIQPVEPGNDVFQFVEPGNDVFQLVEPGNDVFQLVEPGNDGVQNLEPGHDGFQPVESGNDSGHPVEPGNDRVQPVEPGNDGVQHVEPCNDGFQPAELGNGGGKLVEPGNDDVQLVEPCKDGVQLVEPGNDDVQPVEPGNDGVQHVEPGNDGFQPAELGNGGGKLVEPGNDDVQPVEPCKDGVQPVEPVNDDVQPVEPGNDGVQHVEPGNDGFQPAELGNGGGKLVEPGNDDVKPVEPCKDGVQPVEPGNDDVQPVEPGNDGVQHVEPGNDGFQPAELGNGGGKLVEPGNDDVQPVEPCKDGVQPVEPGNDGVQHVEPGNDCVQPVEPCNDGFQPAELGNGGGKLVEPGNDGVQPVEPCNDGVQPVEPCNDGVQPVEPGNECFQPLEPDYGGIQPGELGNDGGQSTEPGNGQGGGETRYNTGEYLLVKYGSDLLPAVVAAWPWIIYYKKYKKKWYTQGDIKHTVLEQDIIRRLEAPQINMIGRALCFSFSDGDL